MKGIYCYRDLNNHGKIVYVGKDSHIGEKRRHKQHLQKSLYNAQQFNRVLQNNPERYYYDVLKSGDFNKNLLKALEILYIRRYQPKFNYTVGGEGSTGYKHTNEAKIKMSLAHKGKTVSEETKRKISENNAKYWKGKTFSDEHKCKLSEVNKGKKLSKEHIEKMAVSLTKNYARIVKNGKVKGHQSYSIKMNGKIIKSSIYSSKLVNWFTKEFPKEILQIKINLEDKKYE